ncbi:MAG: hypothetical protein ACRCSO_10865 [Sphingomonas sp.]
MNHLAFSIGLGAATLALVAPVPSGACRDAAGRRDRAVRHLLASMPEAHRIRSIRELVAEQDHYPSLEQGHRYIEFRDKLEAIERSYRACASQSPLRRHAGLVPASTAPQPTALRGAKWTPAQGRGDGWLVTGEAQKLLGISLEGSVG